MLVEKRLARDLSVSHNNNAIGMYADKSGERGGNDHRSLSQLSNPISNGISAANVSDYGMLQMEPGQLLTVSYSELSSV